MTNCDVAIIGAGPYGLSTAAHLRTIPGLDVRVFGEPMSFWEQRMPAGMLLRSPWDGSHLSDPKGNLTLNAYRNTHDGALKAPIPLEHFIAYGRWFQSQAVPEVDRRQVALVDTDPKGFLLTLEDGSTLQADRVVVATGIGAFPNVPQVFRKIPSELASHSSDNPNLSRFAGKEVVVIGAGQSALESAALLHESGVHAELLVRGKQVHFLGQRPWLHKWPFGPLLYAAPDVGPALISHLVAHPDIFRRLPRRWQDKLSVRPIRPAGAAWLKSRLETVKIRYGRFVVDVAPEGDRLKLKLDDGGEMVVDHALLATGYRVDIGKLPFLQADLLASINCSNGYPRLSECFETSIPGLHFVGAPAAWSFGPLMRFVAGADFTSLSLARGIAGQRRNSGHCHVMPGNNSQELPENHDAGDTL